MRGLHAVAFITIAAAPACSLLLESDDLISGRPASTDASPAADVDVGDGPASDGSAPGSCLPGMLCDDFEGSGNIPWTPGTSGNATVGVDTARPRAGLKSLHALRAAADGRETAHFRTGLDARIRSCEFDAFAVVNGPTSNLSIFKFAFGSTEAPFQSYSVGLVLGTPGGLVEFGTPTGAPDHYNSVNVPELALGRWVHVRMDFEWSAPASVSLVVDGRDISPAFPSWRRQDHRRTSRSAWTTKRRSAAAGTCRSTTSCARPSRYLIPQITFVIAWIGGDPAHPVEAARRRSGGRRARKAA